MDTQEPAYRSWSKLLALGAVALMLSPTWAVAQRSEAEQLDIEIDAPGAPEESSESPAAGKYYLGIVPEEINPLTRAQLGLDENIGVAVAMVAEQSPAAKAGLKQHDVVVAIDGKPLAGRAQLLDTVQASTGKAIAMQVLRAGELQTIEVTPQRHAARAEGDQAEPPQLRALLRRFGQLERGQGPLRLRRVGPGVVVPPELEVTDLPDGVKVKVLRENGEPAKVVIQQGDETWEATEKELNELPERFRKLATGLLRGVGGLQVEVDAGESPDVRIRRFPFSRDRDRELEERMERIEHELMELKERIKQGKADLDAEPASGDGDRAT